MENKTATLREWENKVLKEVREFRWSVSFNKFYEEISKRVIGQDELDKVLANVYNYLDSLVYNPEEHCNNNMIIAAPTGCGKTETYRAIKEYFKYEIPSLPVYIRDLSQYTTAGFKGNDPGTLVRPFIDIDNDSSYIEAMGIVFLDEFDRKLIPSWTHNTDVNKEVQQNLLTIVEGSDVSLKEGNKIINTNKLMFVGFGSFEDFREKREDNKSIGFGQKEEVIEHSAPLTRDNLLEHGGITELIGRFPYIVNYEKLSKEAIEKIIEKFAKEIAKRFRCFITISDEFREELYKEANSKFGLRGINSTIQNLVLEQYTKALHVDSNKTLVVKLRSADKSEYVFLDEVESFKGFLEEFSEVYH